MFRLFCNYYEITCFYNPAIKNQGVLMQPPKDITFDPNKQTCNMIKGSKAVKKYFKNKSK